MKHLLILFAMATACLSGSLIAQEVEPSAAAESDKKRGIHIQFGDEELSDSEKINKIVESVGKINTNFADELKVELDGLDAHEKKELLRKLDDDFDVGGIGAGEILVAVVAIVSVFGLPVFLLIVLVVSSHRKRKQKMELVKLYIANDKELPEHVVNAFDRGGASNSLRSGLVLVAVGFGLTGAFSGENIPNFGLIPLFLGIARLVYWYLEERTSKQQ